MPGRFCIDGVNAKLCASVMCKQACPRLSAWVLFCFARGYFLFGVNLMLGHVEGQIVYDAGIGAFYRNIAQVVLRIGNNG